LGDGEGGWIWVDGWVGEGEGKETHTLTHPPTHPHPRILVGISDPFGNNILSLTILDVSQ
jgi:hypothetical protein